MNRPYKEIPLIALIILIENYTKMVKDNFHYQKDLDLMLEEINIRYKLIARDIMNMSREAGIPTFKISKAIFESKLKSLKVTWT